jgi:hypothetical protein
MEDKGSCTPEGLKILRGLRGGSNMANWASDLLLNMATQNIKDKEDIFCQSCGFKNPVGGVVSYPRNNAMETLKAKGEIERRDLCTICSHTLVGVSTDYPSQYDSRLYRTLAGIGNIILQEINK